MDDTTLLKMLEARFQQHPLLASADLGLTVEHGVAVISGFSADGSVKAVAQLVAAEMPGVRAITNEIETAVGETWQYIDCRIAKKACDLLQWNSLVPAAFRLRVEHARLSIYGRAASYEELLAIGSVLREFSGALSIDNHLMIPGGLDGEPESRPSGPTPCQASG